MTKFFKDFFKSTLIQICLGVIFISPLCMFVVGVNKYRIINYFTLVFILFIIIFGLLVIVLLIDELVYRYKNKKNSDKK